MSHNSSQNQTNRCRAGCGMYGAPSFDGYCSQCFKTVSKSKDTISMDSSLSTPSTSEVSSSSSPPPMTSVQSTSTSSTFDSTSSNSSNSQSASPSTSKPSKKPKKLRPDGRPMQIKKTRCWKCKKKVGLLGFQCACEYIFCSHHRYHDQHDCFIDPATQRMKRLQNKYMTEEPKSRSGFLS